MSISKLTNKFGASYQVRVTGLDGKLVTKVFRNKRDAEAYEVQLRREKQTGHLVTTAANYLTVDEYFKQWFGTIQQQASPAWKKMQERYYAMYISPVIGPSKLSSVKAPHVAKVLNAMMEKGRAAQTRLHVYGIMRKMFSDAIDLFDVINKSPVSRKLRPKIVTKESKYLTLEEARKLLLFSRGKPYGTAIWLGIYMGLRANEVQALRWEDVDLEAAILHVRRSFCKHTRTYREYPKGRRQHSHRIPPELLRVLKEAKELTSGELVVEIPGWKMIDYAHYVRKLKRYCKACGIKEIGTHGLRHSTAEVYMAHGASRDDLRLLFAHSSSRTTDIYVHDRGSRLERVANDIELFPRRAAKRRDQNPTKTDLAVEDGPTGGELNN